MKRFIAALCAVVTLMMIALVPMVTAGAETIAPDQTNTMTPDIREATGSVLQMQDTMTPDIREATGSVLLLQNACPQKEVIAVSKAQLTFTNQDGRFTETEITDDAGHTLHMTSASF